MDRGTWQATVHGSQRVRYYSATKSQPPQLYSKSDKKVRFPISSIPDIGREQ